jgi:hypothetical protein
MWIAIQANRGEAYIQASVIGWNLVLEGFLGGLVTGFGMFCFRKTLRFGKTTFSWLCDYRLTRRLGMLLCSLVWGWSCSYASLSYNSCTTFCFLVYFGQRRKQVVKLYTSMEMDETSKIWIKTKFHPKMCLFIQERVIPSLDFVAIQWFHPLKKGLFITKYSLKNFLYHFCANFCPKKKHYYGMYKGITHYWFPTWGRISSYICKEHWN